MNFQGMVKLIGTVDKVSDEVTKQTIVVEEMNQQYPQSIAVDFLNDRTNLLAPIKVGDVVDLGLNIRAKAVTDPVSETVRHFNSINGWKISVVAKSATQEEVAA